MIFGLFTLAVAIFISGVSAFYSVTGLTAIFAAAFWPIVIMGSALEIGKITATVWLHKYWDRAGWQFKLYLVPAIVVLMLITSMGTYGYLAKAHLDQAVPTGDVAAQVALIDDKISVVRENIQTQRDNIAAARSALAQLDAQTTARLDRSTDEAGAERAVQIRRAQARERGQLQKEITQAQSEIERLNADVARLNEERAPVARDLRKVEAEIGPIKYIAALIYGDNPDAQLLEAAVRWVIILLVLVFDPLALVLILAADQTFQWHRQRREQEKIDAFFAQGKELAQRIDNNDSKLTDNDLAAMNIVPPNEEDIRPFTEEEIAALDQKSTETVNNEAPGLKKKLTN